MEPLVDSQFDEDLIEEFTHGECWSLAAALNRTANLPFIAIYGDYECQHVAVQLPGDRVLDIAGIWDESAWELFWAEELQEEWPVQIAPLTDEDNDRMVALATTSWDKDSSCDGRSVQDIADDLILLFNGANF